MDAPFFMACRAPCPRLCETQVGAVVAKSKGSSPTSDATWDSLSTNTGPLSEPPKPLVNKCGFCSVEHNARAISITRGVFPAPPAVKFPTQITGTDAAKGGAEKNLRAIVPACQNIERGDNKVAIILGRCQKLGARILLGFLVRG